MLWYHSFQSAREPMSSYTHFLGILLSLIGLPLSVLLYFVKGSGDPLHLLAALIFCCSTLALYTTSCVYHFSQGTPAHINHLRKLDHAMIYVLIAGSYTPLALCALRGVNPKMGWTLFGVVWGAAVIGIILTAIDMERFKVFSMICYLAMGWCVVVTWKPMTQAIGLGGTVFLVLGGVSYTIGAMLYVIGKKKNKRYVHSIFHLFVVLGSLLHFFCVLFYVM